MAKTCTTEEEAGLGMRLAEEDEWFDLLPVEKKLICWSLGLGVGLLIVLVLMSRFVEA